MKSGEKGRKGGALFSRTNGVYWEADRHIGSLDATRNVIILLFRRVRELFVAARTCRCCDALPCCPVKCRKT